MDTGLNLGLTRLAKGELFRIIEGRHNVVAVFHGRVWITQRADRRDVVLEGGETFTLDQPGLAVVQALAESSVLVFAPAPTARGQVSPAAAHDAAAVARRMTSDELRRKARQMRSAAISEALFSLLAAPRLLWTRFAKADQAC